MHFSLYVPKMLVNSNQHLTLGIHAESMASGHAYYNIFHHNARAHAWHWQFQNGVQHGLRLCNDGAPLLNLAALAIAGSSLQITRVCADSMRPVKYG
jgi:hypothetical protein